MKTSLKDNVLTAEWTSNYRRVILSDKKIKFYISTELDLNDSPMDAAIEATFKKDSWVPFSKWYSPQLGGQINRSTANRTHAGLMSKGARLATDKQGRHYFLIGSQGAKLPLKSLKISFKVNQQNLISKI